MAYRIGQKEISDEAIIEFARLSKQAGLEFICTPHHESILDFLVEKRLINCIKIGSGEIEIKILDNVCKHPFADHNVNGPFTEHQLEDVLQLLWSEGCRDLAILHCVTSYPTEQKMQI